MKLSGEQFKQIQDALLDAYTEFGLRQMLFFQMEVDLDRVAEGGNLTQITFSLIRWAQRRGQVERLVQAAYEGNQENPQLVELLADSRGWFEGEDEIPELVDDVSPERPQDSHQVFLSYSRKDSQQMQVVYDVLVDAGLSVWTDEGLAVGESSWQRAIQEAIDSAQAMVVLMSPDAKDSKWVNIEVNYALENDVPVSPLLIRGERRDAVLFSLYDTQYEDAREDLEGACERLVSSLMEQVKVAAIDAKDEGQQGDGEADVVEPVVAVAGDQVRVVEQPGPMGAPGPKGASNKLDWKIIVAFVGAVSVVTVAVFGYFQVVTPGQMEIRATQTAEAYVVETAEAEAVKVVVSMTETAEAVQTHTLTPEPTFALTPIPLPVTIDPVANPTLPEPLVLSGGAEPETNIRVYVSSVLRGTVFVDGNGRWTLAVELDEAGNYAVGVQGFYVNGTPYSQLIVTTATVVPASAGSSETGQLLAPEDTDGTNGSREDNEPTGPEQPLVVEGVGNECTQGELVAGTVCEFASISFVYVPEGEFIMGSSDGNLDAEADEKPQQTVYLDAFWIMQTEVTNAMWQRFMDVDGYINDDYWSEAGAEWRNNNAITQPRLWDDVEWNGLRLPVVGVSWYEAEAFVNWLSEESGREMRLPTEAQWEKACRGTDGRIYPWGDDEPDEDLLNFNQNVDTTKPVGTYSPQGDSPYGLADMAGNVWEWTADWYDSGYYADLPERNPQGPEEGTVRVIRGGSWKVDNPEWARCVNRGNRKPLHENESRGFRVARGLF